MNFREKFRSSFNFIWEFSPPWKSSTGSLFSQGRERIHSGKNKVNEAIEPIGIQNVWLAVQDFGRICTFYSIGLLGQERGVGFDLGMERGKRSGIFSVRPFPHETPLG